MTPIRADVPVCAVYICPRVSALQTVQICAPSASFSELVYSSIHVPRHPTAGTCFPGEDKGGRKPGRFVWYVRQAHSSPGFLLSCLPDLPLGCSQTSMWRCWSCLRGDLT